MFFEYFVNILISFNTFEDEGLLDEFREPNIKTIELSDTFHFKNSQAS